MNELTLFVLATLLTIIGTLGLMIFNRIEKSIERAIDSIDKLNIRVAKVIERVDYHEERIKKLEEVRE